MPEQRSSRPRRSSPTRSLLSGSRRRAERRAHRATEADSVPSTAGSLLEQPSEAVTSTDSLPESESIQPAPVPATRQRLRRSLLQPGRGQVIAAVILFVVGLGGVMQVRMNNADDAYTSARREDLIQLLDGLDSQSRRLEGEIAELQRTKTSLQSGADIQRVARQEAEKRVEVLSLLAGTAPAVGPGIRMRIADPAGKVDADLILNAVEEMRDAGAEVIEVNNAIRVVASTWFAMDANGLVIDGQPVTSPFVIEVIGDGHSLEEGARFRGGIVSEITGPTVGGQVQIERLDRVEVDSLHSFVENQYAQPASPPPTPR